MKVEKALDCSISSNIQEMNKSIFILTRLLLILIGLLHCEECENGYSDIHQIDREHRFLTLFDNVDALPATDEDISNSTWKNLKFNVFIE